MKTIVLKMDPEHLDLEKIRIAAKIIRDNGLVAFPTETVYGLGANALRGRSRFENIQGEKAPRG